MSNSTRENKRFKLLFVKQADVEAILKRKHIKASSLTGCVIDCRFDKVNRIKVMMFGCDNLYETYTNKEGFFRFENIKKGKYSLILPLYCIQKDINILSDENFCRINIYIKHLPLFKRILYKILHRILKKRKK